MRLGDRVIVRQWSKNKCHHYVKKFQTFCKAQAWGVLLPTPYGGCLIEARLWTQSEDNHSWSSQDALSSEHVVVTEARLWTQSEDNHNWGSQDALPSEHVVPQI